jgi:hypothetical protein
MPQWLGNTYARSNVLAVTTTVRWILKYRLGGIILVTLLALTAAFVFVALDRSPTPIKAWQALFLWAPIWWVGFSVFAREWTKIVSTQQTLFRTSDWSANNARTPTALPSSEGQGRLEPGRFVVVGRQQVRRAAQNG